MIIGKKMADALNEQIREELFSSYLYFAMAADFESKDWPGVASWMKVQAQEEMAHSLKFYNWINERGGKAVFKAIDKPQETWESSLNLFEAALAHEQHITSCIYDLVKVAREEGDIATEIFLQWFVTEQVEEEANASEIVEKIKKVQNSQNGMYMLDKELSARSIAPVASSAE
jgi:ferritin